MNAPAITEVDLLDPADKRRITVDDHARWQETHVPPHQDDADINELLAELRELKPEDRTP